MPEFVVAVFVMDVDETSNLAHECMFNGHGCSTPIVEGQHAQWLEVLVEMNIVQSLLSSDRGPIEGVQGCRWPRAELIVPLVLPFHCMAVPSASGENSLLPFDLCHLCSGTCLVIKAVVEAQFETNSIVEQEVDKVIDRLVQGIKDKADHINRVVDVDSAALHTVPQELTKLGVNVAPINANEDRKQVIPQRSL